MPASEKQTIRVGKSDDPREIAFKQRPATANDLPGLFWMGGFNSNMEGEKALALDGFSEERGQAYLRYDYSGHGVSGGDFLDGTISKWLEESQVLFDQMTTGPQIVVGSSMGGWLALLMTKAHIEKVGIENSRISGLILIAPAIDLTQVLMWDAFDDDIRAEIKKNGFVKRPSDYGHPTGIALQLIEDGKQHLFGDSLIETGCPVHILQGVGDITVPWQMSVDLVARLARDDVRLTLVKDGDHRLSRPEDLELLKRVVTDMIEA
ncbi:alpha/beta hydrolase [uncultured Cohaesibacter sp.]|uniref:alpha/beta hydrolase n=1 Tax=uncultured Cohaesibacter sp. TaxID=1002546 RepID=UPI002930DD7B|nr:alpha/beta hydrolase [uncultured Cohaesibacter sp.]